MTPPAAARAAAHSAITTATIRRAALALLLAATLLAGGMLAGPGTSSADGAALTVSSIAVTSNAGSDDEYHAGENIVIRVTFSQNIASYTGAALTITLDSGTVTANPPALTSGGTVATVDYTYTVTDADNDADGITVTTGALAGTYVHAGHSTTPTHTSFTLPTMTYGSSLSQSNHKVNVNVTNYDSDGDGLIEIENLDQLNAIRYDLNGSGSVSAANAAAYAAAFPGRSQSHGCPDTADADTDPGPCIGYELNADLDFDTDGSGSVGAADDYPNWTPVGSNTNQYATSFNGNGHTIANLTINATNITPVGLFGAISNGATIYNLGLVDLSITANRTAGGGFFSVGGFVGYSQGAVRTSYATGTISGTVGAINSPAAFGGLVGFMGFSPNNANNRIDASWAAVNVDVTSSATSSGAANVDSTGGLVGRMVIGSTGTNQGGPATVATSWARGTVSSSRSGSNIGGLIGRMVGTGATATASHWDTTTSSLSSGVGNTANPGVVGKTTTELKSPTDYGASAGDTFYGWNIDVDGDATTGDGTGKDDPWDFGTSSQYPALKYADHHLVPQGRDPIDYDADDDGLIDVKTVAQLDAIRYDLDGNGAPTDVNAYHLAFPDRDISAAGRMGCELTDHDSMPSTPDRATCTGYELMANLDFDTDGDGATYTDTAGTIAVDADDTNNYFSGAAGWTPLGGHGADAVPYTATFEGNHHTISNLFINLSTTTATASIFAGLFADIGIAEDTSTSPTTPAVPGIVRNVGLVDPYVSNTRSAAGVLTTVRTGALAGRSSGGGAVSGSYVAGGSVAGSQGAVAGVVYNFAGCLLGQNDGAVTASSASCNATATGADDASDSAGGLLGWNEGAVSSSYATGTATSDATAGGLVGENASGGTVIASYATGAVSATGDGGKAGGLAGRVASDNTVVRASYATGAVATSGGGTNNLGGLVGELAGTGPVIDTSYAIGPVTASGTGVGVTNNRGGLLGARVSGALTTQITNSYWNSTVNSGLTGGGGTSRTTTQLQAPTAYGSMSTDIYMSWNQNLDGQTGNDDPWHFGTNAQYPLLKYGHDAASVALQIARQVGADLVDYDADNDNLIEISALAQLDAVRYDLDGNGLGVLGDDAVAYAAAFPGLPKGMGCPAVCQGYELAADLDFDTDGDGQTYAISGGTVTVDADDTNNFFNGAAGWTSIGDDTAGYSGVFEGNRHTIDHLFIHVSVDSTATRARVGLFSRLDGDGVIRGVGLPNAYVRRQTSSGGRYAGALAGQSYGTIRASSATGEVVVADTAGSGRSRAGGLVGAIGTGGAISASYADVTVRMTSNNGKAGGLVGYSYGGKISASHAMGDVIVVNSPGALVGGLVGEISDNTNRTPDVLATIDSSYARGAISGNSGTFTGRVLAGLVAGSSATARVTNSYWDTSITSDASASAGGGTGQTTTQLQTPTAYGSATTTPPSIYANWNVNVDGDGANDDPWHFGTASQYPTLKYGGFSPAAQGSAGTDYDTDSDGLIEITTLAQLDAIRLDLDGDGRPTSVHAYRAAFPVGDVGSDAEMGDAGRMGCSHSAPVVRTCLGYELMGDLDFDTDDSGSANAADDYWNGGAGWSPLGGHSGTPRPFVATFDGNGNTISNLYINLSTDGADAATFVGLFADIGIPGNPTASPAVPAVPGVVRNVTLAEPSVNNVRSGGAATGSTWVRTGALAGRSNAGSVVRGSAVTGGSVTGRQGVVAGNAFNLVGCLLGYNAGTVRDSSASCAATATGADDASDRAGGLIGQNAATDEGAGEVTGSYATGTVTADTTAGGLVGLNGTNGQVRDSYAEGDVSVSATLGKAGGLVGILNAGGDVADSYAEGDVSGSGENSYLGGLVGELTGNGATVTGSYAEGDVSASGAGSLASGGLGNLVGGLAGTVASGAQLAASYATGDVSTTAAADDSSLGGLTGRISATVTVVRATYATGTVTAGGGGTNNVGGLVGVLNSASPTAANIHSSYAIGAVDATGSGTNYEGGLVGDRVAGLVTASHWDADTTGQSSSDGGTTQTTAALQGPTGYAGIYSAWNIDLDNADTDDDLATGGDDPWHFGGSSQYPVLQHNRGPLDIARQLTPAPTPADYDLDNDNLIDVVNLAQLNAIRHDLNGDGAGMTGAAAGGYLAGYPGYMTGMGCPGTCAGYELRANLDFDTNGDGMVNASDEIADFRAIGAYSATFQGNGHTISNMSITNAGTNQHKGLFATLAPGGAISAVGLINPVVSNGGLTAIGFGALVGHNKGTIYASWVRGGNISASEEETYIGGLVGRNGASASERGTIRASYSTATVSNNNHEFSQTGGLVGNNQYGTITASYAAGAVQGGGANTVFGCLTGRNAFGSANGTVTNSHWDTDVCTRGSGQAGSGYTSNTGQSASDLQAITGYTGIYAGWNVDLDNADSDNNLATGGDDPWDFRVGHYPALKYGSAADVAAQRPLLAEAGAAVEAYSGQTVTLDGSGSRAPSGATYRWTRMPTEAEPMVTITGDTTATPTFLAPTGLTSDTTMTFRLTLTAGGRSVYDEVTVSIVAVRPNQLLSLTLTDSEGDAVGLAPPFVSLRYDYSASVANQIASVTVTPGVLEGSTMTLNGQAATSGAAVEIPLKYRGNHIVIVVTPPEPEPDETMNGETTDGDTTDETVAETPCSVENDGVKPCTYTVTVNRAVPPRLAFVPRSLTIEEGGSGTYTVELDTRILTGAVTIAIASDHPAVTVSPTEVTLKPLDMAPRTITVTAASDADRNNESAVITHTANGAHYYDVIATVAVKVNDATAPPPAPDPALSVSVASLRLAEGGSGSYTVALATRPADNVTVTIASDNADVTTRPASLTFTTANWSTPRRVTASAASDGDTANDAATLTHTASGGGYGDAPAVSVAVSVTDDDTAGLSITPTVLNLIENGISAFIVSLTAQPSGNVTVSIVSDNPDVTVRPASLAFTPADWATPQAVLVIARADDGGGDELATLRMTARGGGYGGQTGQVLASVDDTLAPLPAGSITTSPDAPAGVSVYGPPGTAARASVAAAGDDTPTVATGVGFGIGPAVAVSVSDAPDDGLEICLPVSDALRADAGSALILTLLRYAGGSWTELAGARDLGDRVCAAGVAGQAAYAAGYALRPGTVLDLVASVDTPGTIALSWTPPAAGASQVAVVVNVADDTDYCLDTLPGLDASSYTCAGRTAGQTYVALLIVLLPDGGYTLANIVRFDLPAAARQ